MTWLPYGRGNNTSVGCGRPANPAKLHSIWDALQHLVLIEVYNRRRASRFRRNRGVPYQELTDLPPFARFLTAANGDGIEPSIHAKPERLNCFQILSPISMGFLGLIIAIVLWGTAYKLSLYHSHLAPASRTQVAKLWLEPRTTDVVSVRQNHRQSNSSTGTKALDTQRRLSPGLVRIAGFPNHLCERQIRIFAFPKPSRSPPSSGRCLS